MSLVGNENGYTWRHDLNYDDDDENDENDQHDTQQERVS